MVKVGAGTPSTIHVFVRSLSYYYSNAEMPATTKAGRTRTVANITPAALASESSFSLNSGSLVKDRMSSTPWNTSHTAAAMNNGMARQLKIAWQPEYQKPAKSKPTTTVENREQIKNHGGLLWHQSSQRPPREIIPNSAKYVIIHQFISFTDLTVLLSLLRARDTLREWRQYRISHATGQCRTKSLRLMPCGLGETGMLE